MSFSKCLENSEGKINEIPPLKENHSQHFGVFSCHLSHLGTFNEIIFTCNKVCFNLVQHCYFFFAPGHLWLEACGCNSHIFIVITDIFTLTTSILLLALFSKKVTLIGKTSVGYLGYFVIRRQFERPSYCSLVM